MRAAVTALLLVVAIVHSEEATCPRGCQCRAKNRKATCEVRPNDKPSNIINLLELLNPAMTDIEVRAGAKDEAVLWDIDRNLLEKLKALTSLSVPASGLKSIGSASFVDLVSLTSLDVSDNDIRRLIPGSFSGVKSQFSLNASQTNLTYLDGFLFRGLKLTHLDLSGNAIKDMNEDVFNDCAVISLDLSWNKLTMIRSRQIAPLKSNLTELDLSNNEITTLEDNSFQEFSVLKILNLNHNKLLRISDKLFASQDHTPEIKTVNVRNNLIRDFSKDFLTIVNRFMLDIDENPLSCNCFLKWLKTNYGNATCETDRTCFTRTTCIRNGEKQLVNDVLLYQFVCTAPKIDSIDVEEDKIRCKVTGDPLPVLYFLQPSGEKIESITQITGNHVTATVHLNRTSTIGQYQCVAEGFDGKAGGASSARMKSRPFGLCDSRHAYFDSGVLAMAVVGTFAGCIFVAIVILLWQKVTKKKPPKKKYKLAPTVSMTDRPAARPPRPDIRPPPPRARALP